MSSASRDDTERGGSHAVTTSPATRSVTVPAIESTAVMLFSGDREIIIAHGEDAYRLRLTSQNKLILTK